MARAPIPAIAQDAQGNALAGATCDVQYRANGAGTGQRPPVYTSETGAQTVPSVPIVADQFGFFPGWVDRGAYALIVAPPAGVSLATRQEPWDATPGADGSIDPVWLSQDLGIADTLQPGVIGPNDLAISVSGQNSLNTQSAAGIGWVPNASGLLVRSKQSAAVQVPMPAPPAAGANPRVDWVYAALQTSQIAPQIQVLSGAGAAGVTNDAPGAEPAQPVGSIRVAQVLRQPGETAIAAANIRDRRPWARGAEWSTVRTQGDYSVTNTVQLQALDAANLSPRVECSGAPVRLSLKGTWNSGAPGTFLTLQWYQSGLIINGGKFWNAAGQYIPLAAEVIVTPTPGSYVFAPYVIVGSGSGSIKGSIDVGLTMEIAEIVRANRANG